MTLTSKSQADPISQPRAAILSEAVKEITLYTTDFCSYCERTKALLRKRGLHFTEVNLGRDHDSRAALVARTGLMSFPQVLIGGVLIGGYAETAAAAASGRLDELLAA